jgi:iron complex outermembrane receptor protein
MDLALEQHLPAGGVLSASIFHRRIEGLIRRRIGQEIDTDPSMAPGVARWVSRPVNFGAAHSSGLELEIKGHAGQLLPAAWQAPASLRLRAAVSLYRSKVEQLDDPEARIEGQAPWRLTLGLDRVPDARSHPAWGYGFNLTHVPAFSTQQSDLQRVWRSAAQRLDVYLVWRVDKQLQWRLAGQNIRAVDSETVNTVEDLDGWAARAQTRRGAVAQWTAHLVWRY